MRRSLFAWALALSLPFSLAGSLLLTPPRAAAVAAVQADDDKTVAGDDALVKKIRTAINEGVSYLKGQQRRTDGSWEVEPYARQEPGGTTSLVLLALLNSGLTAEDPAVKKGLEYIRKLEPTRTYSTSLATMAFCLAKQNQDRARIARNVKWLLASRLPNGWFYQPTKATLPADNSNTQYALLALHEAAQAGFKVDEAALRAMRALFVRSQTDDGGWGYRGGIKLNPEMTMTTAGLCNLMITGLDLAKGKAVLQADGSAKDCGQYTDNEAVAKALKFIGDRYPARMTDANALDRLGGSKGVVYYCLYGVERAGRLTGQRFFGGHDWYEVGCRFLVGAQKADGSWSSNGGYDRWPVVSTSFAVLFLAKGKAPVLVSKVAYGGGDYMGWNNKRGDVKNLVEFASKELFKGMPLAWQAFDVRGVEANDEAGRRRLAAELLQSPVVFFNGHDFAPRDKEEEVLKEYVANGGFIFAENCCGRDKHPKFDQDFRKLMKRIFPDSELKDLEPEHPVWTASGKYALTVKDFPLQGIKQGCKTVVIYSPTPLAGWWETNKFADKSRGQKAFEMGANVIAYATGLEPPRPRLSRVEIAGDGKGVKPKRGFLQVGQLKHQGDWQPAPKAMRNLMAEARKVGLDVMLKTEPVFPSEEAVLSFRFLYMHGRGKFDSDRRDLKHLRFALMSGGMLLADACCGAEAFDASFRKLIEEVFAQDKLKLVPVPPDDDLYGADLNGEAIRTVRRRAKGPDGKKVDPELKTFKPALEGVKYKGRWVVLYSKYDIGCALEKHSSPECLGHDHASALKLARAAVLYALKR